MPMIKSQFFEERLIAMSLRHVVSRNARNRIVAAGEYDDLVFALYFHITLVIVKTENKANR